MNAYVRFDPELQAQTSDWPNQVETTDRWTLGSPVGHGEASSSWIDRYDGLKGVAKPAFDGNQVPRAGHEKIAADLAALLGVPVPRVLLHNGSGGLFSISSFPFRQPWTWGQAETQGLLTPTYRLNALAVLATGYVFHVWIDDQDHTGNAGNVLIDADAGEDAPGIAFIDHAFSMTYRWNPVVGPCVPLTAYYGDVSAMPRDVMVAAVERLEAMTDATISGIVDRIPELYLPATRANIIRDGLKRRRTEVRAALGL